MKEILLETQQETLKLQPITAEEIQDWLANQIAEQLGVSVDDIDSQANFDSYGLNSLQAMSITNLGKQIFGVQLSPILLWNYPNIESLSRYLAEELENSDVEIFEF